MMNASGGADHELLAVIKAQHDHAKAVQADDAEVPIHLRDERICRGESSEARVVALATLRDSSRGFIGADYVATAVGSW